MYMRMRNFCGFLGVILPWVALFSAGISTPHPGPQWWWSISATYYQTPALVSILTPCSLVLILYIGFNFYDNLVTTLSGLFGLGIMLFPCKVEWLPAYSEVGFFQLPMDISNTLHCICACGFFVLLSINSLCLFVKTNENKEMTPRKIIRNHVYKFCGWSMLAVMGCFVVLNLLDAPGWTTMLVEIILLHLFGITWLVKGEAFPFLNDKEDKHDCDNCPCPCNQEFKEALKKLNAKG